MPIVRGARWLWLLVAWVAAGGGQAAPPNIVLILADDMGYGDVGVFNAAAKVATLNIDRLATEGLRFTDAHAAASTCTPSRYGLLTGINPTQTGVGNTLLGRGCPIIGQHEVTLPAVLQCSGFVTRMVGKWHLGFEAAQKTSRESPDWLAPLRGRPVDRGFDSWFGIPSSLGALPLCFVDGRSVVAPPTSQVTYTKQRESKGWAYEGGCRIPFIVVGPGIAAGAVNRSTPVNLIDLLPTFAAMAGALVGSELDVDGCNLVPVLQAEEEVARHADGSARDTLYFHYPVLNGAFSTIRQGPWKLLKNTAPSENTALAVQLFQLSGTDGEWLDLSEADDLIEEHRDIAARLLAKLDGWLQQHTAGQPYKNASYRKGGIPGQDSVPAILRRGHSNKKIWATYETDAGKAAIQQAFLLFTINPGAGEEWFQAEAVLADGRVEAVVPPGMTHGIFCLVDANNFLVTSEPVPSMQEFRKGQPVSEILKDGYAYRPGLEAMVGLGRRAMAEAGGTSGDRGLLSAAVEAAETLFAGPGDPPACAATISRLREAIRSYGGRQAEELALNWFPRVSGDGT